MWGSTEVVAVTFSPDASSFLNTFSAAGMVATRQPQLSALELIWLQSFLGIMVPSHFWGGMHPITGSYRYIEAWPFYLLKTAMEGSIELA